MTQTGFSNAVVNAMLGWLKGLASWVLKLFNLSGGVSPLKFLADHWLQLLILLLAVGVLMDLLIWLIRWRPHWVWFRKRRVVINDRNFFADERYIDDEDEWDAPGRSAAQPARPRRDWEDSDFVVRSEASRRPERKGGDAKPKARKTADAQQPRDVFQSDLFNVNTNQKFSDKYEDEVFDVNSLPRPVRPKKEGGKRQGKRRPGRSQA